MKLIGVFVRRNDAMNNEWSVFIVNAMQLALTHTAEHEHEYSNI